MKALLECTNVNLTTLKRTLCRKLNFTIHPGETWGLLGPNGSGKTTLLHTIAGLRKIDGHIQLHGKNISSFSRKEYAKNVGLLIQETRDTFPQTVYELCSLGRYPHLDHFFLLKHHDKNIIANALVDMELIELSQEKIHTLSGGERKRLSIATLLTQTPQLYLLDEPLNHLDLYYQIKILTHLKNLAKSTHISIMLSLHDINLTMHFCSHVLMICPDGSYIAGPTTNTLSTYNLSKVYQHPIKKIPLNNTSFWIPAFENEKDS